MLKQVQHDKKKMFSELKRRTGPLHQLLQSVASASANLLFPPRCVSCGVPVESVHSFCLDCFAKLQLITAPHCSHCGVPFEYDLGHDAVCAACLHEPPRYTAARAAMHYDDYSRGLITRLKYGDHSELVPALAQQLRRAGGELTAQADWLVPVPLHSRRLRERKFNQSALLAFALSDVTGVAVMADGLLRVEDTPPQASLTRKQRLENVKKAFRVNHKRAALLRGVRVLLIDDVMTTGATIDACSKVLLGAGVTNVYVLTVARTVRE